MRRRAERDSSDGWRLLQLGALVILMVGWLMADGISNVLLNPGLFLKENGWLLGLGGTALGVMVMLVRWHHAGEPADLQDVSGEEEAAWRRAAAAQAHARQPVESRDLGKLDWFEFEKLVEVVLLRAGYPVQRSGGAKADGGIDLVIQRDGEEVGVQCKHWKAWKPGVRHIREFVGALKDRGLKSGVFISTNEFTAEARELAGRQNIELWAGQELNLLIEKTNAWEDSRVQEMLYSGKKQCPKCEREMVLRKPKKQTAAAADRFWGCSGFPRCRFTMKCS